MTEHAITRENAYEYQQARKRKILKAIEAGLMKVTDAPNPAEALAHIVSKRAEIALSDNGRAGNEAARLVLQAADALQERKTESEHTERHVYEMDAETMRVVEELVRMRRESG